MCVALVGFFCNTPAYVQNSAQLQNRDQPAHGRCDLITRDVHHDRLAQHVVKRTIVNPYKVRQGGTFKRQARVAGARLIEQRLRWFIADDLKTIGRKPRHLAAAARADIGSAARLEEAFDERVQIARSGLLVPFRAKALAAASYAARVWESILARRCHSPLH